MDLTTLLEPTIDLARVAAVLDGLGHEGRVHATRTWGKKRQVDLYEAAKGNAIDLDFLVPAGVGKGVEVIHQGHNTLLLHNEFQKRFVRLEGDEYEVAGYNFQSLSMFSGPGYFVVRPGEGEHEGELAIDYTKLPKTKPAGWPELAPNGGIIPGLVYGNMIDYLRKISAHVSIGRAWKHGKPIQAWFALVRKDAS
jgi:hypothetical protein